MRVIITVLFICLSVLQGKAQNTFQFKGLIVHNKSGPKPGIKVLIDGIPAVTNSDGLFVLALPNATSSVVVSLEQHSGYTILYPYGGAVLIPRDLSKTSQIIIGDPKDDLLLQQYLRIYHLLKNKQSTSPADIARLNGKMDSLYTFLIRMNRTDMELKLAKEMQDGKDDYFPIISGDLIDYRIKAFDLKVAFKTIGDQNLRNRRLLEQLTAAANSYNASFNKLSTQHLTYERRIADYWQSDSLRNDFHNLAAFALDTIHAQNIYPMQPTIEQIQSYFLIHVGFFKNLFKKRSKKDKRVIAIRNNISVMVSNLDKLLPILEDDTRKLTIALAE